MFKVLTDNVSMHTPLCLLIVCRWEVCTRTPLELER